MDPGIGVLALAALAGVLTLLNPCVLPLIPLVAGAAMARSRLGLVALAAGLALSFTLLGVAVARSGALLGIAPEHWRAGAGVLLVGFGATLVSARLQGLFQRTVAGLGERAHGALGRLHAQHPLAQAGVGMVLGVAWTPCIGPTLGSAVGLASAGQSLGSAAAVMGVFSVAAVTPLVVLGAASHTWLARRRGQLAQSAQTGRVVLGWTLLVLGAAVLSGADKVVEAWLLDHSPAWLMTLTTRF